MTKYTLIAMLLLACACGNEKKKQTKTATLPAPVAIDSCELQKQTARVDLARGKLKYYVYGIAAPTAEFIAGYRQHNIEVVSWGCVLPNGLNCYNTLVDSIMHK